jgi:hypothetical protein
VKFDKEVVSFTLAIVHEKPPGTLRLKSEDEGQTLMTERDSRTHEKPNEADHKSGGHALKDKRKSPRPVILHTLSAEDDRCCWNSSSTPSTTGRRTGVSNG